MRYLALFALPLALAAQPADGDKVTQALITEIQQLRMAIERSTLLSARTQLALGELQLQESAVARLQTQLNDARGQSADVSAQRVRLTTAIDRAQQERTSPEFSSGPKKDELEMQIKSFKIQLEQVSAVETARSAREGELASQLQAAQAQAADSRSRIAEMERALDAAIQQMLRPK